MGYGVFAPSEIVWIKCNRAPGIRTSEAGPLSVQAGSHALNQFLSRAPAYGVAQQFGHRPQVELFFDVQAVGVNGLGTDVQPPANVTRRCPCPNSWKTSNSRSVQPPSADGPAPARHPGCGSMAGGVQPMAGEAERLDILNADPGIMHHHQNTGGLLRFSWGGVRDGTPWGTLFSVARRTSPETGLVPGRCANHHVAFHRWFQPRHFKIGGRARHGVKPAGNLPHIQREDLVRYFL